MSKRIKKEIEKKIIKMYQDGIGSDSVGKIFEIHPNSVLRVLKRNEIERRDFTRKLGNKHEEIIQAYLSGLSTPKIAEQLNVTNGAILKVLKKNNIKCRDNEECRRKYPIYKDFFDKIDTEEKAYFLGFLYADGCNGKAYNWTRIELAEFDKNILYKLAKLIYKENSDERVKVYFREDKQKWYAYLNINSKYICGQLEKLGCIPVKSLILTYPDWMPDHLQKHFIRGYYDGDGGIHFNERNNAQIKIISSLDFITSLKNITTKKLNIHWLLRKHEESDVYTIYFSGNRQARKFLDWLYKDSNIYLDRKYNLYLELQNIIKKIDKLILVGTRGYSKSILLKQ